MHGDKGGCVKGRLSEPLEMTGRVKQKPAFQVIGSQLSAEKGVVLVDIVLGVIWIDAEQYERRFVVNLTKAQVRLIGTIPPNGVVCYSAAQQVGQLLDPAFTFCDIGTPH